jgi:hypothetical protein
MNSDIYNRIIKDLDKELNKLNQVFKLINSEDLEFQLAKSYYEDAKYFKEVGKIVEAFELVNYVWGILDTLARKKCIKVPEEIKKWFKV